MFGSILTLSSARAEVILYKSRGEFFYDKIWDLGWFWAGWEVRSYMNLLYFL